MYRFSVHHFIDSYLRKKSSDGAKIQPVSIRLDSRGTASNHLSNKGREPSSSGFSIRSLIGIFIATVVFIIVWVVGGIAFNLFDSLRGLGNDHLQAIFRDLFVPAIGGYVGISSADSILRGVNLRIVFFGFSALVFIFIGFYIGFVGPVVEIIGKTYVSMLLPILCLFSAVCGAYVAMNKIP